jgi:hypothetical protein
MAEDGSSLQEKRHHSTPLQLSAVDFMTLQQQPLTRFRQQAKFCHYVYHSADLKAEQRA